MRHRHPPNRPADPVAFDGNWHHIAWVDNNGAARLYVDGVLDATDFNYARGVLTPNIATLGAVVRTNVIALFNGAIDDAAVWRRALTQTEIRHFMVYGDGIYGTVTTTNDSGHGSLRAALTVAFPGDIIFFHPMFSNQTFFSLASEITVNVPGPGVTVETLGRPLIINDGTNTSHRLFNVTGGTLTLRDITLANGGGAGFAGDGGAIRNAGVLFLDECVLSGNSAASGGAIYNDGTLNLTNSIVARNTGSDGDNVAGPGSVSGLANLTSGDPILAPLGDYGGFTPTMALMPGSPARDAAPNSTATSDQRGVQIIGAPDIGAYQAGFYGWETGQRHIPFNAYIWESLPTTNVAAHDPGFDYDGDGASNNDEFRAHTDAANAASVFRILSITPDNGTNLLIHFSTVPTLGYNLLYSGTLPGTWVADSTPFIQGDGTNKTFIVTPPPEATNRFYRVSGGRRSR